MTEAEFQELIDRLGERMADWPADKAAAALVLLDASPRARAIRRDAQALRRAFEADTPARAPAGLVDRILARAFEDDPAAADPLPPRRRPR